MHLVMYRPSTSTVWADALFASMLQRSDGPTAGQVRKAVAAAVRAYGSRGCAERVAQEFGDHPETAVEADDPLALRREYAYYDPIHTLPAAGQQWWQDRARRPESAGMAAIGAGLTPAAR